MAAQEQISIIMQVIDRATAVNDKVKSSFKSVEDTLKRNAETFKTVGLVSGAAFGVVSLAIGKSISEAKESQQVNAQLEAVLKSTGGTVGLTAEQIKGYASALQGTTGIADDVIQSGQNMLLTFTNIKDDVFPGATSTLLDMATAMSGGAAPSAEALKGSAIQLGKALNDPIEGISALSRVGVTFTEDQKKMIEGLVEMGDTAGAQKVILAELNKEFGGSAAAQAATFDGRMRILKETMNGVYETIGNALIPILTKTAEVVTPIIEKIASWVGENPKLTATIFGVIAVVTGIVTALAGLGLVLPSVIAGFTLVGTAIGPIGWAIMGIIAAVGLLVVAWKTNFLGIQDITKNVWGAITSTFQAGIDWITQTIKPFLDEIQKFWTENGATIMEGLNIFFEGAKQLFMQFFDGIKLYVGVAWDIISGVFGVAYELIKANFKIFFEVLTGILTVGMQVLNGDWSGAWETVKNTFSNVGATIVEAGKGIFEKLYTTVTSIVERIEKYVSGALRRIKDTMAEIASLGRANTETYNAAAPASSTQPARAFGGSVRAGQAYTVGENGQETFVPASNGRIANAKETASGGGVSIYVDMSNMTVTGEADEDRLVDKISQKLGRQFNLARGGLYT